MNLALDAIVSQPKETNKSWTKQNEKKKKRFIIFFFQLNTLNQNTNALPMI